MARFDRYLLSQLLVLFGFFALVLVLILWVNRAVGLFDQLIANGQTAWVFLEFSILMLPVMIATILPFAAFFAAVFVANRLTSESELVVAEAAGYSPFRLARPAFSFGLFAAIFTMILAHLLVPMSQLRLAERQAEIAQNVTARFLTEGTFVHPADGITLYIREISPEGELRDVFLTDSRGESRQVTYTAQRALVVRAGDGPRLIMFQGLAQVLELKTRQLTTTGFDDFTYDISSLMSGNLFPERAVGHLYTPALYAAAPELLAETGADRAEFLYAAHRRTQQGLMTLLAALTGFTTLLLGGFSRFGLWRQIMLAGVILMVMQSVNNSFADIARSDARATWLTYAATPIGLAISALVLWVSARPALFSRRGGFWRKVRA